MVVAAADNSAVESFGAGRGLHGRLLLPPPGLPQLHREVVQELDVVGVDVGRRLVPAGVGSERRNAV